MPIPLPNLDDRRYAELLEEARASIPALVPEWTDHNPSDPGITLIEVFAFVCEALLYRTNQITDRDYAAYLRLINGSNWQSGGNLDADIRASIQGLRARYRAVTPEDYEYLALNEWPRMQASQDLGRDGKLARAKAYPRRNMEHPDPTGRTADMPGHLTLVIVPDAPGQPRPTPRPELINALHAWLDQRRMLGTFHHVVPASYLRVAISARLVATPEAMLEQVQQRALEALQRHFQPIARSADAWAWPFGRDIYVSEIYQILDRVAGVDYVVDVAITTPGVNRLLGTSEQPIGVQLQPYELVELLLQPSDLKIEKRGA